MFKLPWRLKVDRESVSFLRSQEERSKLKVRHNRKVKPLRAGVKSPDPTNTTLDKPDA